MNSDPTCRTSTLFGEDSKEITSLNSYPKCVLPFNYKGKEVQKCTSIDKQNTFWCPTEVDPDGSYKDDSMKWGVCNERCPKEGNQSKIILDAIFDGNKNKSSSKF